MRTSLAFLLLALWTPAAAQGESYPPSSAGTIGPRLVWYIPADGDRGTWNPGVQARRHFGRFWALEGSGDYQRHEFPRSTAHTAALQASALAYLLPGRVSAFLLGGAGYYLTRVHADNYRRNLGRFAPHAGAGAQFFLNDAWSADLAYRHVFLERLDVRDGSSGATRSFKRSGEQLSFGVNYRLGAH